MPILSLTSGKVIITYTALFIAYLVSIALAGGTQAWTAKAFGDDTPEEAGYLSFNPVDHIHFIGLCMFVLLGVGFGPIQPVDSSNIRSQLKELKLLFIFMTKPLVNIAIAIFSLVSMLLIFGYSSTSSGAIKITMLVSQLFQEGVLPIETFFKYYPELHSFIIVSGMLLIALLFANVIIAPFNCILNLTYYCVTLAFERESQYLEYLQYFLLFGPFLVLYFFGGALQSIFLKITLYSASIIASILGVG